MTGLLILLAAIVCALTLYFRCTGKEPIDRPLLDPEAEAKAAVELHRVRRNLDTSLVKSEQRRDAERVRRSIAEALDDKP